jgi:hypothetical protein
MSQHKVSPPPHPRPKNRHNGGVPGLCLLPRGVQGHGPEKVALGALQDGGFRS